MFRKILYDFRKIINFSENTILFRKIYIIVGKYYMFSENPIFFGKSYMFSKNQCFFRKIISIIVKSSLIPKCSYFADKKRTENHHKTCTKTYRKTYTTYKITYSNV